MKDFLKKLVKKIPIAFTKNQKYDRDTNRIIQMIGSANPSANCIDVGCHKGEVLDTILKFSPSGKHFGFEPIPHFYENLKKSYPSNCSFYQIALSDSPGETSFNYVVSNPSYSGLKKRRYDNPNEEDTKITVKTERLDSIIPEDLKIDLIKIDVEGAELLVLKGAEKIIKKYHPVIVFEHGIGGADCYDIRPEQLFDFMENCGMGISLLNDFLNKKPALSRSEFVRQFDDEINYYFAASSK